MKPLFYKVFVWAALVLFVSSCLIPASKERYLANFERFVKNVEKNASEFKKKDWIWAERRYRQYSEKWYAKFKEDLTLKEQIQVATLRLRFQAVKEGSNVLRHLDEKMLKDLEKLNKDMGKYFDENFERDLEKITKGAREIGDSARKVVDDLMKELRKRKE